MELMNIKFQPTSANTLISTHNSHTISNSYTTYTPIRHSQNTNYSVISMLSRALMLYRNVATLIEETSLLKSLRCNTMYMCETKTHKTFSTTIVSYENYKCEKLAHKTYSNYGSRAYIAGF